MLPGLINPNLNLRQTTATSPNFATETNFKDDRPKGFFASIILDLTSIISSVFLGWSLKFYVVDGGHVSFIAAAIIIYTILSSLQMLLARSFTRRAIVIAICSLGTIGFILPIYLGAYQFLIVLFGITYLFFAWGEVMSHRMIDNSLKIKFFEITKPVVNKILTGIVLVGVLIYLPGWQAEGSVLSRQNFNKIYSEGTQFLGKFWTGTIFTGTLGDFLTSYVKGQYETNQTYRELLPVAQEKVVSEARIQVLESLKKRSGINLEESMFAEEAAYQYVISLLEKWRFTFGDKFLAVWGVATFFLVRGAAFVLYIAASLLSFFVYETLIAMNIIHTYADSQTKESIDYSVH